MIYCKYCGADLPPNKEVRENEQIKIEELIPFMKKGWVACDKNGSWTWYSAKPKLEIYFEIWDFYGIKYEEISNVFNIAPVEDWQHSLIKIERK